MDLPRIELGSRRCKRCVLPLDYRPSDTLPEKPKLAFDPYESFQDFFLEFMFYKMPLTGIVKSVN